MANRNIIRGSKCLSTMQVREALNVNNDTLTKRLKLLRMNPKKVIKGVNYYSPRQIQALKKNKENDFKFYPLKSIETFHIYESKINSNETAD